MRWALFGCVTGAFRDVYLNGKWEARSNERINAIKQETAEEWAPLKKTVKK